MKPTLLPVLQFAAAMACHELQPFFLTLVNMLIMAFYSWAIVSWMPCHARYGLPHTLA